MYLNRITFSLDKSECSESQIKDFQRLSRYLEELIFYCLSRRVNLGGFGFFDSKILVGNSKSKFKTYGQIIDFTHFVECSDIREFFESDVADKVQYLLQKLEKAVCEIKKKHQVDDVELLDAINRAKEVGIGFEQKLEVSKSFKNRKGRVEILRQVCPTREDVFCRIVNNQGIILSEFCLQPDTTIYDASYNFRKSKWEGEVLYIYNRFNEIQHAVDVTTTK